MTAYIFAEVRDLTDQEAFREYITKIGATQDVYGGKNVIRGTNFETLEGDWSPSGFIVLEFPDRAKAMDWYNSEEYKPLKELRKRLASTNVVIMDGR